jgi:hypothetical protein
MNRMRFTLLHHDAIVELIRRATQINTSSCNEEQKPYQGAGLM